MKVIKISLYLYIVILILLIVVFLYLLIGGPRSHLLLLWFSLLLSIIMAVLAMRQFRKLKVAGIILDNQILQIRSDAFISCFGVLLHSKVIKFNQEGIKLFNVEIRKDSIRIRYGRDKDEETLTLPCDGFDEKTLNEISQRFRYETGITPKIMT